MRPDRQFAVVLALALPLWAGCADPTALLPAPEQDRLLILELALDPDSALQPLLVETTDVSGTFEGFVRAEVHDETGVPIAEAGYAQVPRSPLGDIEILRPCIDRYGEIAQAGAVTCLHLDFRPEYGARYRVRVMAEGRPPAEATTRVPGDFELLAVTTRGSPPGTEGLDANWTPSEGAYRYLVALRSDRFVCYNVHGCLDGWFAVTDTAALHTTVPETQLEAGSGPWHLDVYAVDRALYEYLTTGSGGELFAIPPVENVEGGHGVVGAWVRRSQRVP